MRYPSRRSALCGAAAAGGSLLLARPAWAQPTPTATPIVTAGLAEDSATPVLWAIRTGAFRKAGLDVSMQDQRSGPAVASGVIGGTYQIGKASLPPLVDAHARGIPFVIVAPAGLSTASNPIAGLMVRADSPIKNAVDLNGKTVAVGALTDIFTLALRVWVDKNGGDSSSLKLVEIPIGAIGAAIETGRVVAGSANEPILGAALASGKLRVLARTFDAISPQFMFTAWFTTRAYLQQNPLAVAAFRRVVEDAARYTNAHHAETVDDIAQFTKLDPALVRTMARTECGTRLDPSTIQPVIDASAKYKDIPAPFDARDIIAD
jgi:NitT/TauT family transport system substrate-binding protein